LPQDTLVSALSRPPQRARRRWPRRCRGQPWWCLRQIALGRSRGCNGWARRM